MASEAKGTKWREMDEPWSSPASVSFTSFTLMRNEEPEPARVEDASKVVDTEKPWMSLKLRPWILLDQIISTEKLETKSNVNISVENPRPKGVIHGCPSCNDCQKVTARWCPEEPCRPILDCAPVFHPTEEEFTNTLAYIAKIRPEAEEYGICSIVPPDSWRPRCLIEEKKAWKDSKFQTRVQPIDELQNLLTRRKLKSITDGFEFENGPEFTLETFEAYGEHFKGRYFRDKEISTEFGTPTWENVEGEYWRIVQTPTEQIEVLSGHNLEAKVLGTGFPSLGDDEIRYIESGWNLNNTPKLPGSLLAFESSGGASLSAPRVDVGMCFSSICWKVEEHHLYSLSYMHIGAPRIWYGVPGRYYHKCEAALKKIFRELSGRPELFHKPVIQLLPSTLKSEGIPVYRCVQHPRQFILVFPGAYDSGFDVGFNVSESVNLAPVDWLPHGNLSVEIYSETHRKTSISYDKMLMEGVKDTLKALWLLKLRRDSEQWKNTCGTQGRFTRALKSRVKWERLRRECLCFASQSRKMVDVDFDSTVKRECIVCYYDLHFAAASCACSSDRYSCLVHSKQLCSCPLSSRMFLFRYGLDELDLFVDALEGKVHALFKWARGNRELFSYDRDSRLSS